jgi:hypothetical protein
VIDFVSGYEEPSWSYTFLYQEKHAKESRQEGMFIISENRAKEMSSVGM